MPKSPPSACTYPGCPKHAVYRGRCADHQRQAWASTTTSPSARGYGRAWKAIRDAKLARDPVCEVCNARLATAVDHITPKARGGTDDPSNLQSICNPCHTAKTTQDAAAGRASRASRRAKP